jgi:hypothetical protein
MSLVSVVCCQVEVSATSWSLIQRSPTDCGVSQMYVIMKPRRNEEAQAHIGLSSHKKKCPFKSIYPVAHKRCCTSQIGVLVLVFLCICDSLRIVPRCSNKWELFKPYIQFVIILCAFVGECD